MIERLNYYLSGLFSLIVGSILVLVSGFVLYLVFNLLVLFYEGFEKYVFTIKIF